MKCERCGKINPAEIHTCSPNYVDRRQWKYDPMTGEPLVDGWPLYSGLPQREWQGLTDDEIQQTLWKELGIGQDDDEIAEFARAIEAKLKEKNT